jgi:hypothetical protein
MGAKLESEIYQIQYEKEIKAYITSKPIEVLSFDQFIKKIMQNDYATSKLFPILTLVEEKYNSASTFPELFRFLAKQIKKEDKCKFFKDWLEEFISSRITLRRAWKINLVENDTLGNVLNASTKRPMGARQTRKQRNTRRMNHMYVHDGGSNNLPTVERISEEWDTNPIIRHE